jgi:DNA-binding MarR family transcriptional regulator
MGSSGIRHGKFGARPIIGRLAAATETTGAATTQLVNGLAAAGYVTRERPEGDKRSVLVILTDAGRQRHQERQATLAGALDTALTGGEHHSNCAVFHRSRSASGCAEPVSGLEGGGDGRHLAYPTRTGP